MKVAIVTMFKTLTDTYSLVSVVRSQIEMLLDGGNSVRVLVSEECRDFERTGIFLDARVEWIKLKNSYQGEEIAWNDYYNEQIALNNGVSEQIGLIADQLWEQLKDIDICILHDILYQGSHYIHNQAIRKVQQHLPELRFLAFTHSFPFNRPNRITKRMSGRFTPLPNTLYAYPTQGGIIALAKQYDVPVGYCRVVYHPIELIDSMSNVVKHIHEKVNLLRSDILIIYPLRLTTGKQPDKVVQLAGALQTVGEVTVQVIFCDFPSADIDGEGYKREIRQIGIDYGLESSAIVFTSDLGYKKGIPKESVKELFSLSTVYICPSMSESFGLTVLEAARGGNLLIVNENVPALKEIGKELNAHFMKWNARCMGYDISQSYEPSEASYYGVHAKKILEKMEHDYVLQSKAKARTRFNKEWIWQNQLEPILRELMQSK